MIVKRERAVSRFVEKKKYQIVEAAWKKSLEPRAFFLWQKMEKQKKRRRGRGVVCRRNSVAWVDPQANWKCKAALFRRSKRRYRACRACRSYTGELIFSPWSVTCPPWFRCETSNRAPWRSYFGGEEEVKLMPRLVFRADEPGGTY